MRTVGQVIVFGDLPARMQTTKSDRLHHSVIRPVDPVRTLHLKITLAAICLKEEEFIGAWLSYHYASFDQIIICEGAARNYPRTGVSGAGLSIDRTAEIVTEFPDPGRKIRFIRHGWAGPEVSTDDRVPAKMELRNIYA